MASTPTSKLQAPKPRKRVDADLKRGSDGSAFTRCGTCKRDIAIALLDMHDCKVDAQAKVKLMEILKEAPTKKNVDTSAPKDAKKRKGSDKEIKTTTKKTKPSKDPSMPKKPATAFFLFMEDFRKTHKAENPSSKGGAEVAKLGGEKWKAMTDEEKSSYTKKALELKAEYDVAIKEYNKTKYEKALKERNQNGNEKDLEEGEGETED